MPKRESLPQTTAQMDFIYLMCNDPDAIKGFYGDLLGMQVTGGNEFDYVCIEGPITTIFFKGDFPLPVSDQWAWQPGNPAAASGHLTSWSVKIPFERYPQVIAKIMAQTDVPKLQSSPEWRRDSYWALTVRDPMGNTVEVYGTPDRKPDSLQWKSP